MTATTPKPVTLAHPGPTEAATTVRLPRQGRLARRLSRSHDPLWRAVALLDVRPTRVALAVLLGVLSLGSAVALAAVSAWLIARASQMPPVLTLSIATVGVRTFGIGRGVFRYVERLTSHDVALRGMANLRTALYQQLAVGRPEATLRLRRGDLLTRVGADVDAVGDAVVRGLLPIAVAVVLGLGTTVAMGLFLPAAGLSLAACLLLAGVVAPWLAARAARTTEQRAASARATLSTVALGLLDDAGPLTVQGRTPHELAALREADRELASAADAGARPAALGALLGSLATGVATLAALVLGVPAVHAGVLTHVELAVIVLTPLASFEAVSVLPAAAIQLQRSRAAARRIMSLLDEAAPDATVAPRPGVPPIEQPAAEQPAARQHSAALPHVGTSSLRARGLSCGWPGRSPVIEGLDLDVRPGRSIAVVGPSGAGKTTLLLTLAGLIPARAGDLDVDGTPISALDHEAVARHVVLTSEDAHVFETSVLENLRVARGDVTPDEAVGALERAGLGPWLAALPDGVDTELGPDAQSVSGGERRRLLLARALLSPAPLLLVDEPAEHLDSATADRLVRDLLSQGSERGVVLVTHRLSPLDSADEIVVVDGGRVTGRGSHAALLASHPGYREGFAREHEAPEER
ncbi:thiol reductant ABC exporter subunit CydC [Cellulomonas cellasea]|uniref:thiol reductant ABC exporter subunit CydC n=1 Tax=Cellulomonas cellasea TaxID=43670 RepID=UPI0025A37D76|nr:thiol reductant ABC exporter subunit CydC [Cellulomonas cellasea]MDM8084947.1 thiol reductant ABC exporter subunit CydC [Cellulomonas cellasea]